ncbi:GNAT family N-acetyltransferase [Pontibacter silvestris]|uniref:GNAT family N-acetyltransferase n=1 Tax=Pontibacter silvestris TaxID=2305183 RepID=A0ABW4WW86_9BACT|nr:GNAT family N-acetyltransferase [Pontibacter silvestris]MCC9136584.1 GNAT family N-acetyltransferase [Pontibacter silvestris]
MLTFSLVSDNAEIESILLLQKANLACNLSAEEIASQGFVTVAHNPELLRKMNEAAPSIIAKDENKVIGYAIAMTQDFKNDVPVLIPMFQAMDKLEYKGKKLHEFSYVVSGQVCVAKEYRGQQVFDQLYHTYKEKYAGQYDLIVTEIASRNSRSLKAHGRIGFEVLHSYLAPDGENWEIVIWDLRK